MKMPCIWQEMFITRQSKQFRESMQMLEQTDPSDDNRWRAVQEVHQDNEETKVAILEVDAVRSRVFTFIVLDHS